MSSLQPSSSTAGPRIAAISQRQKCMANLKLGQQGSCRPMPPSQEQTGQPAPSDTTVYMRPHSAPTDNMV